MTAQLLLDEMYSPALAGTLREKGHDVRAVPALPELVGADDRVVLDTATVMQRCLVTENIRDFAILIRQMHHGGVLFVHARRWPRTPNGMPRLAGALDQAIGHNQIPRAEEIAWLA